MEQTQCWYGLNNPVSLVDVRQAGVTSVVIALHHVLNDGVWSIEEILKCKVIIEDTGLVWSVIESVPTHEDTKTHTGNYEQWIVNCQQTPRNPVQCGTHTACYNSMLVLDRTRTDFEYVPSDGSEALRSDQIEFAAFEMHILKRPGAEVDYAEEGIAQTAKCFAVTSDEDKARLTRNIIAGLPGAEEGYILDQFRKHLELYKDIDRTKLRESFAVFPKAIIPVVEKAGVRMVVHPNDPPCSILGPPRIVPTIEDMRQMVDIVNSMTSDFTIYTGSYGVHVDSDPVDIIKQFGLRIYFTHLRSTVRKNNLKTSHEAAHLSGGVDMCEVVKVIVEEEHRRKTEGREDSVLMRPDHDHQMSDDLKRKTNPGYSAIGRLEGLAEARGAELVIQYAFSSR